MNGPNKAQVRRKLKNHNFVSVKFKHLNTNALLDTEAFYSCVSLSFLKRLKLQSHIIRGRWPYNPTNQFTVEHIAGNKLTAADGLSRRPYDEPANLEDDEELQEDSFIAHIEPDIFDSVSNYDLKHGPVSYTHLTLPTNREV